MDMKQLAYFVSIAQNGSYSQTAKEFFVTQPAISRQIMELENELGVKLFTRNTRKVSLTREGAVFIDDAKKILSLQEDAFRHLRALQFEENQKLSIAYLPSPVHRFLPLTLHRFLGEYPYADITTVRKNAREISNSISREEFDIYFSNGPDFHPFSELDTKILQTDCFGLLTAKNHPAISRIPLDYVKLASEPFLMLDARDAPYLNAQFHSICKQLGFTPRITHVYHNMQELIFGVEAGFGISILPSKVNNYMSSNLAFTPLDISNITMDVAVAWHRDNDNPLVYEFLQTLSVIMQEHPELF